MSGEFVVRLRGLPWQATEEDITNFFLGLKLASTAKDGLPPILLALSPQGRPTGEAYARFDNEDDFNKALAKDKERMGQRYIEVFSCPQSDMERALTLARGVTATATATHEDDLKCAAVIRMRGLPFRATEGEIIAFFEQAGVHVLEGGVLICRGSDGRVTGEAYVQFGSEEDARRGLQRHKDQMGTRYIELFRSSKAELLNVLRRQNSIRDPQSHQRYGRAQGASWGGRAPDEGGGGFVARLRGLPFSAGEEEIAEWFSPMPARCVHLILTSSGRPSGDAFAEFNTEAEWEHAMSKNRQHMGSRYVEIFPSTMQELMNTLSPVESASAGRYNQQGPVSYRDNLPLPHHYPGPDHHGGPNLRGGPDYGGYPPHYSAPSGNYNPGYAPMGQSTMPTMGSGMNGPLGSPGIDPTIALLQLTSALSQQAAQARAQGAPTGQSQLDMMMRQAANPAWGAASAPTGNTGSYLISSPSIQQHTSTPTMHYGGTPQIPAPRAQAPYSGGPAPYNPPLSNHSSSSGDATRGVTLHIRGVPFRTTPREIIDFFAGYDVVPESVQLGRDEMGYSTGEAWATFRQAEEGYRALREKNRAYLGSRYVELFLA